MNWNDRRNCTTKEEAIEVIASVARSESTILLYGAQEERSLLIGRIQEFAEFWGIEFDKTTMLKVAEAKDNEQDDWLCSWEISTC